MKRDKASNAPAPVASHLAISDAVVRSCPSISLIAPAFKPDQHSSSEVLNQAYTHT